ncbi:histone H1-like [Mangifera indica]|uniref:histone H1-like n=1 Tax=Mangifera indica TaxID=29780 RepID=UPI001CF9D407|nr:histone H1-like [Mangifera indica]
MAPVTAKTRKEGTEKAKKAASAPKKLRAHPPYSEMINEAITALKERTGSSQIAIAKFIEEKQKANLPNNFKKLLLVQLKKLVADGKLVKVKNSFKLPPKSSSTNAAASVAKNSTKASVKSSAVEKKPTTASIKAASNKATLSSASSVAKKPKSASTKPAAKKLKTTKAKEVAVKSPVKKVAVAAKAKKPKSIKSPVKKAAAKKGKK